MPEIEVGGATLEIPEDTKPEQIKKIVEGFRKTPEFDSLVDKSSGAPARVRMLVGSAPEQDKLANLKRFYPDAVQHGEDNFVFTDPASGKPTLYNPQGFDFGDIASVAKEGVQAVGATLGATVGAVGGLVAGVPAAVPTAGTSLVAGPVAGGAIGAGIGNAVSGQLFDMSAQYLGGQIDTRSVARRVAESALDFVGGAVGQRAGELVGTGVQTALQRSQAASQYLVQAFKDLGIQPPAGAVSQSRTVQTVEKSLQGTPTAGDTMQKQAEQVLAQTKTAADNLSAQFGDVKTKQGAGEVIRQAAVNVAERFKFTQEKAYSEAFDLIGADTPVAMNAVTSLRNDLEGELARAPQSLSKALEPAINMLKSIEQDASGGGGIAFDALRQVRTMVGKEIDSPLLAGSSGSQNEALKLVYVALTDDMSAAARGAGPEAAKKLAVADRFTRQFMNTSAKTMQKISDFDADEKAFQFALSSSQDGGTALARMRRHFTGDEWDTVAGTVLGRMGLARAGAQDATGEVFSPSTFLTNFNKLAPEAKEALFGGSKYEHLAPELDKLVKVISSLKEVEKVTNSSNTAKNLIAYSTITTLGAALGGLSGGDVQSAGQGSMAAIVGSFVAPRIAAKLITSPSFVKWLTTPVKTTNGISAHLSRLTAIAEAEPDIRQEIHQYAQALRNTPVPTENKAQ